MHIILFYTSIYNNSSYKHKNIHFKFIFKTRLPMPCDKLIDKSKEKLEIKESQKLNNTNSINVSQNKMVRTDCSEQKIDKFLNISNSSNSTLMLPKSKTNDVITRLVLAFYLIIFNILNNIFVFLI